MWPPFHALPSTMALSIASLLTRSAAAALANIRLGDIIANRPTRSWIPP
jgi:hypothetical protein